MSPTHACHNRKTFIQCEINLLLTEIKGKQTEGNSSQQVKYSKRNLGNVCMVQQFGQTIYVTFFIQRLFHCERTCCLHFQDNLQFRPICEIRSSHSSAHDKTSLLGYEAMSTVPYVRRIESYPC